MVKWVPKATPSSTSTNTTSTPRIPNNYVGPQEEELEKFLRGDSANEIHSYSLLVRAICNQLQLYAIVQGVTHSLKGKQETR